MVPKPGFTNQNPTIGSILGQNTSLMSDPTFFQDIGLQGIYMEQVCKRHLIDIDLLGLLATIWQH